jgi:hypothetical protein
MHPRRRSTEAELIRWRRAGDGFGSLAAVCLISTILFISLLALPILINRA